VPDYFTHRDHTGNSQLVKSRRPIYADDRAVCESARGVRSLVQENYRALLEPRSREPSHFSNSFPKTFWAHFGTARASFMSSPA